MTQRLKAIKTEKSFLCQSELTGYKHMPLFQWRHVQIFGKQVTYVNVFGQRSPEANLWAIKLDLYWIQRGRLHTRRDLSVLVGC